MSAMTVSDAVTATTRRELFHGGDQMREAASVAAHPEQKQILSQKNQSSQAMTR